MKLYTVAVLGATGAVGQEMMKILEERNFPVGKLVPLASARSAGKKLIFRRTGKTFGKSGCFVGEKFVKGNTIVKRCMLLSGSRFCCADDTMSDTQFCKGLKTAAGIGGIFFHCGKQTDHTFLKKILTVSPCKKIRTDAGLDHFAVTQSKFRTRSIITVKEKLLKFAVRVRRIIYQIIKTSNKLR